MPTRLVVLSLLVLFAMIVGLVAGALSAIAKIHPALAVIAGSGAFGSTILLGIGVWGVLK
jgi:hypothetical protein